MTRDLLLPEALRAEIVRALYADANQLGWANLGPQAKTTAFNRWIDDPRVGGRLTGYMSPEQARLWIKDGPMKEYARAMRGTGRFAEFGRRGGTSPQDIVNRALGDGTNIDGNIGTKPPHCLATASDGTQAYVTWGDTNSLKHLLWAALRGSIDHGVPGHIVVLEPPGTVTPTATADEQRAITDRCGLTLHHLREVLGSMTPVTDAP
ncbi:MAG: hypothetical protein Q8R60_14725 [Mycobacteriales bacterium]|nr:hypothetical protein [Mycobacteriales bacterium]